MKRKPKRNTVNSPSINTHGSMKLLRTEQKHKIQDKNNPHHQPKIRQLHIIVHLHKHKLHQNNNKQVFCSIAAFSSLQLKLTRTWHISAMSGLACEQKKPQKKDKNKRKEMVAKKQISIKKNCLVVCFFQMDGFFSLFTLLQVNYADMVHAR